VLIALYPQRKSLVPTSSERAPKPISAPKAPPAAEPKPPVHEEPEKEIQ
jgi:hypothetical protein